ncbi:adiponectin receptor protein 2 [Rhinophrynus dorsalis]
MSDCPPNPNNSRGAGSPWKTKSDTEGSQHPMNRQDVEQEGCSDSPESVLRLRRGHMPVSSEDTDSKHDLCDHLCPLLVDPPQCPVPNNNIEDCELEEEEEEPPQEDEGFMGMAPLLQAHHAMERVEEFVCKVWEGRWRVIPHDVLPDWLKDNDYLLHGHRPPMPSFRACFKSIFRIHTETGNIWTHLLVLSKLIAVILFPQFHSHQLFHIFVVAGAFVHFHGVSNLQEFRFTVGGGCAAQEVL